jgi:hypothetical protein
MLLLQQGKKWPYPLQRFEADTHITLLFGRQCKNNHCLHNEPCTHSYLAIQEYTPFCYLRKGGSYKCKGQCGLVYVQKTKKKVVLSDKALLKHQRELARLEMN